MLNLLQGDNVYKSVFIIFFQGDQLKTRVKKICEGFRATLYPCPEAPADRREMAMGVMTRIEDLNTVLGQTQVIFHLIFLIHNETFFFLNLGSSSSCISCCRKELEKLVRKSSQDQGNLSYIEFIQFGCDTKMSHC